MMNHKNKIYLDGDFLKANLIAKLNCSNTFCAEACITNYIKKKHVKLEKLCLIMSNT